MSNIDTLHATAQQNPEDATAWFELGIGLLAHARATSLGLSEPTPVERAAGAAALLHALQLEPADAELSMALARALFALHLHEDSLQALALAEAQVRDDESRAEIAVLRGRARLEDGDPEGCLADIELARSLGRQDGELHLTQARALRGLGRLEEAQRYLEGDELASTRDETLLRLHAEIAGERDDVEACLRSWDRLHRLAPDDFRIATARATALLACERTESALEAFRAITSEAPRSVDAHLNLASALKRAGRFDDAIRTLDELRQSLSRPAPDALIELGKLHAEQRHFETAAELLAQAADIRDDDAEVHFLLAQVRDSAGDRHGAVQELMRAASIEPGEPKYREALESLVSRAEVATSASAFQGSLDTFGVLECIEFLRQQRTVGRLQLSYGSAQAWLYMHEEQLLWAEATGAEPVSAILGRLVEDLPTEKLAVATASEHDERAVVDRLENDGVLTTAEARAVRKAKILSCLDIVIGWKTGSFAFQKMVTVDAPPGIDAGMILLECLRVRDERALG